VAKFTGGRTVEESYSEGFNEFMLLDRRTS